MKIHLKNKLRDLRWQIIRLISICWVKFVKSHPNESQIVICGFPRSGTSLLFNIISGILETHKAYTGSSRISKEVSFKSKILEQNSFITKQPSDIFNLKHVKKWNARNKKIIVFICVRDIPYLLVSKHQMIPNKYYMDFNTRLDAISGKTINTGIKDFHAEIKRVRETPVDDYKAHVIFYEELIQNPNMVNKILTEEGLKPAREAVEYAKSNNLPYTDKDTISKGNEAGGVKQTPHKWQENNEDAERLSSCITANRELIEIAKYYGYDVT